jgi:succinate dehydrogenase / fumarate reductase iron-sulfur subunit
MANLALSLKDSSEFIFDEVFDFTKIMKFISGLDIQSCRQFNSRISAIPRMFQSNMVSKMDEEGFGNCTNTGACEVECPKGISLTNIARMNREFLSAAVKA